MRKSIIKLSMLISLLISMCFCLPFAFSERSSTFLGPTLSGTLASSMTDRTAYSFLGEAGGKNFRVGGTIGWDSLSDQRLKFSAEYLWQKIRYDFVTGGTDQWVNQGAVGAVYQYDLAYQDFHPQFNIAAYLSHAPNKNLNNKTFTIPTSLGTASATDFRRIAGSNAGGISPGLIFDIWRGGKVELDYNYDKVKYDTKYRSNQDAIGSGGTISLSQLFSDTISGEVSAGIRQPFNLYQASLNWIDPNNRNLSIGLSADYTAGKTALPSTYNVFLNINYLMGAAASPYTSLARADHMNAAAWVSKPAVHMSQVLAIADERIIVEAVCPLPSVIAAIPDPIISDPVSDTIIPTAFSFNGNGSPLTFSLIVPPGTPLTDPPSTISVDPTTGVVTFHHATIDDINEVEVLVVASNGCGSVSNSIIFSFHP